jgi:predicted enzyme related to lactoylglutathione lyase
MPTRMETDHEAGLHPLVHLELHTRDLREASSFYHRLFGWHPERVETRAGPYQALEIGGDIGGGIVECSTRTPLWLPYVEVHEIHWMTQQARRLGATVTLAPREGPCGWRSAVRTPPAGEIALWQPKDRR